MPMLRRSVAEIVEDEIAWVRSGDVRAFAYLLRNAVHEASIPMLLYNSVNLSLCVYLLFAGACGVYTDVVTSKRGFAA